MVPVFEACPMPKHQSSQVERNARIVMTYFHPWTLNEDVGRQFPDVPHARALRRGSVLWAEGLESWWEGGLLCDESRQYVCNFLGVTRVRPSDRSNDVDENSDDLVSDEELVLGPGDLAAALETRIGGRRIGDETRLEEEAVEPEEVTHFQNSSSAISRAHAVWEVVEGRVNAASYKSMQVPSDLDRVFRGARASQSQDRWLSGNVTARKEGSLRSRNLPTRADAEVWLETAQKELKPRQFLVLKRVVDRVMVEEEERVTGKVGVSEPLRYLMHGGPGVGKSHVIKKIRDFFSVVMGWEVGVEYNLAALQAIMAIQIGGETLHHVAGINPFQAGVDVGQGAHVKAEAVAKRLLPLRWLVVDEVSMVSANLLAQVDMKLRGAIREQGTYKVGGDGRAIFWWSERSFCRRLLSTGSS